MLAAVTVIIAMAVKVQRRCPLLDRGVNLALTSLLSFVSSLVAVVVVVVAAAAD